MATLSVLGELGNCRQVIAPRLVACTLGSVLRGGALRAVSSKHEAARDAPSNMAQIHGSTTNLERARLHATRVSKTSTRAVYRDLRDAANESFPRLHGYDDTGLSAPGSCPSSELPMNTHPNPPIHHLQLTRLGYFGGHQRLDLIGGALWFLDIWFFSFHQFA